MLTHPTLVRLHELGLHGMARAFAVLRDNADAADLAFEDRLGLMLEADLRTTKRYQARLRQAKLRLQAAIEDVDFRTPRGLDKTLLLSLADCRWVTAGHNLLIVGPTGSGKTWLACALGHRACRDNLAVLYVRLPRLAEDLALARVDGRYPRLMAALGRASCSFSTIGAWPRWTPTRAAICWKSSTTATVARPP
jgi:DNA replication protein DnaC